MIFSPEQAIFLALSVRKIPKKE